MSNYSKITVIPINIHITQAKSSCNWNMCVFLEHLIQQNKGLYDESVQSPQWHWKNLWSRGKKIKRESNQFSQFTDYTERIILVFSGYIITWILNSSNKWC